MTKFILALLVLVMSGVVHGQSANDYFKIASQKFQNEDYAAAAIEYTKAIEIESESAVLFNNRGLCYSKIENWSLAQADYTTAITLDIGYKQAYLNLGNCYASLADYQSAIIAYDDALKIDTNYNKVYAKRAYARFYAQDYRGALQDYNKAIANSSTEKYSLYNARGAVNEKLGNVEAAIKDYDEALTLNPKSYETYINRGILKTQLKRFDDAIDDFTVAQSFAGMNGAGYFYRGICRIGQRELIRTSKEGQTVEDLKSNQKLLELACSDLDKAKKFSYGRAFEAYQEFCVDNPMEGKLVPIASVDTLPAVEAEAVRKPAPPILLNAELSEREKLKKEIKAEIIAELLAEYELVPRVKVLSDTVVRVDTLSAGDSIILPSDSIIKDSLVEKNYKISFIDSIIKPSRDTLQVRALEVGCMVSYDSSLQLLLCENPTVEALDTSGSILSLIMERYEQSENEEFPIQKTIVNLLVTVEGKVSVVSMISDNSKEVEASLALCFNDVDPWKPGECNQEKVNSIVKLVVQF